MLDGNLMYLLQIMYLLIVIFAMYRLFNYCVEYCTQDGDGNEIPRTQNMNVFFLTYPPIKFINYFTTYLYHKRTSRIDYKKRDKFKK